MEDFRTQNDEEIQRINVIQGDFFSGVAHLFEPPLPEGVPDRLKRIVSAAQVAKGDVVLDVGSGTGILIPLIQSYEPFKILACDLSKGMLKRLKEKYGNVETILSDVRDLTLPDASIDVVFINACYANIADKQSALANIGRLLKPGGRMVISHPLGRSFVQSLKDSVPFPLDELPGKSEAETLFPTHGLKIKTYIDEPNLYLLIAVRV